MSMFISAESLRAMYPGGRADAAARRMSRWWAWVIRLGLLPRRWVTLEVAGRRTGLLTRFPLGMADLEGRWYLVPMLGARCNWVENVRAADGRVILRRRRGVPCQLTEVPAGERAPILRRYLEKVPGARPHIPVGQDAPLAEFEAISARYPVFRVLRADDPGHPAHRAARPERAAPRKRHWWRWVLAGAGVLVVLAVLATGLFVKLQAAAPSLALPAGRASAPAGPLSGTWTVAAGSQAGFRVRESAMGFSNDVVGRTDQVSGTLVISGDRVTRATLRIRLTGVTVNGKSQPQFARSLGTRSDPVATFSLTRPVTLAAAFTRGSAVSLAAAGQLTMHQVSRPVTVALTGRRDGPALQAAGSIPVTFSRWGIVGPQGLGFLGSLARNGTAEFLLILRHGGASAAAG
jgi:polyisoprenoid-binding protein YceI